MYVPYEYEACMYIFYPIFHFGPRAVNTPSPRVTRNLVPEKPRVMRNPRNAGNRCTYIVSKNNAFHLPMFSIDGCMETILLVLTLWPDKCFHDWRFERKHTNVQL